MSTLRLGRGSEWHLMRYLAYHRNKLDAAVAQVCGASSVEWVDFCGKPGAAPPDLLDAEWCGMDFLGQSHSAQAEWATYWPQRAGIHNWDAVGQIMVNNQKEWLLVEAKGNVEELKRRTDAKEWGGRPTIRAAMIATQTAIGLEPAAEVWLGDYYQYANRLAALHFLMSNGIASRLLFIYFTGDNVQNRTCPQSEMEWEPHLRAVRHELGLKGESQLELRVHRLFLPVIPITKMEYGT